MSSKIKLIIGVLITALLSLGTVVFFYYWRSLPAVEPAGKETIAPNWYNLLHQGQWNLDMDTAVKLADEGRFAEAIRVLENIKLNLTDPGQKSVIDLMMASTAFLEDRQKGAERFALIANTEEYPRLSRAYAMLVVADHFDGLRDKNLLIPFFGKEELAAKDASVLIGELYKRIYDTYPFGLAAGKLAGAYIRTVRSNGVISDADSSRVNHYVADIDRNLVLLETTKAFKRFIPVTLLVKANLFRLIEGAGRPTQQPIPDVYLLAIARARTLQISSTEQFSVLFYADYMAEKQDKSKVMELLSKSLSRQTLNSRVRGFLMSEESMRNMFPNLYKLQQEAPDVQAVYKPLTL